HVPQTGFFAGDPVEMDPRQWALLPTSPGYQAGPQGRDLGADVSRIGAQVVPHQPPKKAEPYPADKDRPFLLTQPAPGNPEAFKHFAEVLAVLKDGDTIEVHGNGPFPMPRIDLVGRQITLRAAAGYRLRFVPATAEGNPLPGINLY